jgi:hypothetical protein
VDLGWKNNLQPISEILHANKLLGKENRLKSIDPIYISNFRKSKIYWFHTWIHRAKETNKYVI